MAVIILIAIVTALSVFPSLTTLPRGNDKVNLTGDRAYLMQLAENAWNYFKPGNGVDATTGLHGALDDWPYFTDWDLGLYIQTVIDVERLGLISRSGDWGADARFDKILKFLENRELTPDELPYWWYETKTGNKSGEAAPNFADAGKLLVALQNLRLQRPDLAGRVNHIVYERTNYEPLKKKVDALVNSINIYDYYVTSGFACFWPERFSSEADTILNNIVNAPKVSTYGVELPMAGILCEPLFHSIFELKTDARITELTKQVYLAHEARYNATGQYVAFSEGNTALDDVQYAYEWVVQSDGRTWVIQDSGNSPVQIKPIVFLKVSVGFLAIYNTEFAKSMTDYLLAKIPQPVDGYMDGIDEDGRLISTVADKTNGLIISAVRYALVKSDLKVFPWAFTQGGLANNTAVVIGTANRVVQ